MSLKTKRMIDSVIVFRTSKGYDSLMTGELGDYLDRYR